MYVGKICKKSEKLFEQRLWLFLMEQFSDILRLQLWNFIIPTYCFKFILMTQGLIIYNPPVKGQQLLVGIGKPITKIKERINLNGRY